MRPSASRQYDALYYARPLFRCPPMLPESFTPTRLIDPAERPPIVIAEPAYPSRYRSWFVLGKFVGLLLTVLGLALRRRLTIEEYARRLRAMFEDIGGLWITVGQLLALRVDVFPLPLCRELSQLQGRTFGFPEHIARAIIEADLGGPVERFFDDFDGTPFAAVPMGQVHRARLRKEGIWVAVKVQQPWSAELFAKDLVLIRWFARLLILLRVRLHMRWKEGLEELEQLMKEELDFHFEASSMRRMKRTLRRHGIFVPRVFSDYCGPHVIVSQFIHAVLMADYIRVRNTEPERLAAWLDDNNIQPRLVAKRLIASLFRQILEDNLYHGNMQPGNIVLLRNSRIALVDFRTINFTEREYLQRYRLFIRALATRDYAKAADLAFMLCAILPVIDIEMVKEQVIRALRAWATRTLVKELPYDERSIDHATAEVVRVLFKYRCTMEWGWLRIHRAMWTLDYSLAVLRPDMNHTKQALLHFRRANRRSLSRLVGPQFMGRALGSVRTAWDIQERLNEYTMFQGSLIRRHAQVFQGATNKFADTFAGLVAVGAVAILVPGVLLLALLIGQRFPGVIDTLLGAQVAQLIARLPRLDSRVLILLLLTDVYFFVAFQRLKRRLRQKDVRPHERVATV